MWGSRLSIWRHCRAWVAAVAPVVYSLTQELLRAMGEPPPRNEFKFYENVLYMADIKIEKCNKRAKSKEVEFHKTGSLEECNWSLFLDEEKASYSP